MANAIENLSRLVQMRGAKADVESGAASLEEGAVAYATDTSEIGIYTNGAWVWIGGGSGASAFTDLTDVPAAYTGQAGKFVKVNAGETALEFASLAGGGDMAKATYDTDDDGSVDLADAIDGADAAGNSKYYGTDSGGTVGFHDLPTGSGATGFYGTQLLRTVVAAGGQASFDLSSIDAGYDVIKIFLQGKTEAAAANDQVLLAFNNDGTAGNYRRQALNGGSTAGASQADDRFIGYVGGQDATSIGQTEITITNYAGGFHKTACSQSIIRNTATGTFFYNLGLFWENTAAINRITLTTASGSDFAEGTLCVIVGYKNHA